MEAVYTEYERAWIAWQLYRPIREWETRLIRLHPGDHHDGHDDELVADLLVAVVTDAAGLGLVSEGRRQKYDALSYTWGRTVFTHMIRLNGLLYSITERLYHALLRLRQSDTMRYIWVDALCIDQASITEKPLQIGQMINIYQKAECVVVWLGDSSSHTHLAARCLEDFSVGHEAKQADSASMPRNDLTRRPSDTVELDISLLPPSAHQNLQDLYWGIENLIRRDWLRRVWIIQEVYAARSINVLCGSVKLSWTGFLYSWRVMKAILRLGMRQNLFNEDFKARLWRPIEQRDDEDHGADEKCFEQLKRYSMRGQLDYRAHAHSVVAAEHQNLDRDEMEGWTLFRILADSQHLSATDDRDRVYALLNLAGNPLGGALRFEMIEMPLFKVDYAISTAQVYINFMNYVVNRNRSLKRLYDICSRTASSQVGQGSLVAYLPSFVPDWRSFGVSAALSRQGDGPRKYSAEYVEPETRPSSLWEPQTSHVWHFKGTTLACIATAVRPGARPVINRMHSYFWRHKAGSLVPGTNVADAAMTDSLIMMFNRTRFTSADNTTVINNRTHYNQVDVHLSKSGWTKIMEGQDTGWEEPIPANMQCYLSGLLLPQDGEHEQSILKWQVPQATESGDLIVRVVGGFYPLVLRPQLEGGYTYVGYARPVAPLPDISVRLAKTILEAVGALVESAEEITFREEFFRIH